MKILSYTYEKDGKVFTAKIATEEEIKAAGITTKSCTCGQSAAGYTTGGYGYGAACTPGAGYVNGILLMKFAVMRVVASKSAQSDKRRQPPYET